MIGDAVGYCYLSKKTLLGIEHESMVKQIEKIAEDLRNDEDVEPVSVRRMLRWFGAQRRGSYVVWRIRNTLLENGLRTSPDFEGAWIDGLIHFQVVPQGQDSTAPLPGDAEQDGGDPPGDQPLWVAKDPSHQISKLASANQEVATITPNDTVEKAITKMLFHDFSQLPVSTGDRNLEGVVSWKTIGKRIALNGSAASVREVMDHAHEVRHDSSMFDAMRIIAVHDYVIVRAQDKTICGIVTATDLNEQFRYLSEPFLLLSEIENLLRNIIGERFSLSILKEVCNSADSREVTGLSDLTFGEYIRLLENRERWEQYTRLCSQNTKRNHAL